jgi:hypothetical protein
MEVKNNKWCLCILSIMLTGFMTINLAKAQLVKGVVVNLGFGSIYSKNMNRMLAEKMTDDNYISLYNSHSNIGALVGAGAWFEYQLSERSFFHGGMSLNYQSSKLYINYSWDSLDYNKTGRAHRISSENSIKVFDISMPLVFKYKLFENKKYYFVSGLTFSFSTKPILKSLETQSFTEYQNSSVYETEIEKIKQKVVIKPYSSFNAQINMGFEKEFRREMKKIRLRAMVGLPFTKSKFYTKKASYYESFTNNQAFTMQGKNDMERQSKFKLNDFRKSTIVLSIYYAI